MKSKSKSISGPPESGKHVVVVGVGAIGSHVVAHLARTPAVARVTLVDPDVYDASNLRGQNIGASDVGRKKVHVQARRLRSINPGLSVATWDEAVESMPRGRLRADVILACLDSRRARQSVNELAFALGVAWIDAGVSSEAHLARVDVYRPGRRNPCLECAWDARDYAALEQRYPCLRGLAGGDEPAPTNASSSLGALAASLQMIECEKLISKSPLAADGGTQVLIDVGRHKHYVTRFRRNPHCLLPSHESVTVELLSTTARDLELGEIFGLAQLRREASEVHVAGKSVIRSFTCMGCTRTRDAFQLVGDAEDARPLCRLCRHPMRAAGLDTVDRVGLRTLPAKWLARNLASLGFRAGEIVTIGDGRQQRHVELGGTRNDSK